MLLEAPYKAAADHFIQGSLQKHLQHEGQHFKQRIAPHYPPDKALVPPSAPGCHFQGLLVAKSEGCILLLG